MNYRHAFHAGNHTEILKHAVLVQLLRHLRGKEAPFFVLDTHAGLGFYDLASEEARRTNEASAGIKRVINADIPHAEQYLGFVRSINPASAVTRYPGSPGIIQHLLRQYDGLAACELHSDDVDELRRNFKGDRRIGVHHRDGYESIKALLPPPQGRGLVFVDPPFERPDEVARLLDAIELIGKRWPAAITAVWYPIKNRGNFDQLKAGLRQKSAFPTLTVEVALQPEDGVSLAGGGVVVIKPPWKIEGIFLELANGILRAFEAQNGRASVQWIVTESDLRAKAHR